MAHTAHTTRTARTLGIAADQLAHLADYSEKLARDYMAQGMSLNAAAARATEDTLALAASLGIAA